MNPTRVCLGLTVIALLCAIALYVTRPLPSLTIMFNGVPAADIVVTDIQSNKDVRTDMNGIVRPLDTNESDAAIWIHYADGHMWTAFPKRGNQTIDLYPDRVITETPTLKYGFIPTVERSVRYHMSDEEAARVKRGETPQSVINSREK